MPEARYVNELRIAFGDLVKNVLHGIMYWQIRRYKRVGRVVLG